MTGAVPALRFARLTEVPLGDLVAHMSDPRLREHMPLLTGAWGEAEARAFVAAKEACWARDGLGHWAFFVGRRYVGWGGFQKEGQDWDFGLVLKPDRFGLGMRIARRAIDVAVADPRIPAVTFLLPLSRTRLRGLDRLGARFVEEVIYDGVPFRKYHLDTP